MFNKYGVLDKLSLQFKLPEFVFFTGWPKEKILLLSQDSLLLLFYQTNEMWVSVKLFLQSGVVSDKGNCCLEYYP